MLLSSQMHVEYLFAFRGKRERTDEFLIRTDIEKPNAFRRLLYDRRHYTIDALCCAAVQKKTTNFFPIVRTVQIIVFGATAIGTSDCIVENFSDVPDSFFNKLQLFEEWHRRLLVISMGSLIDFSLNFFSAIFMLDGDVSIFFFSNHNWIQIDKTRLTIFPWSTLTNCGLFHERSA